MEITSDVFEAVTGIGVEFNSFKVMNDKIYYHFLDRGYMHPEEMPLSDFYKRCLEFCLCKGIIIESPYLTLFPKIVETIEKYISQKS